MRTHISNKISGQDRKTRIKGCETCKGAPVTKECILQNLRVTYCDNCMEVVDHQRIGQVIISKEQVAKNIEAQIGAAKTLLSNDERLLGFGKILFK